MPPPVRVHFSHVHSIMALLRGLHQIKSFGRSTVPIPIEQHEYLTSVRLIAIEPPPGLHSRGGLFNGNAVTTRLLIAPAL
jgi:hypothetical protein